MAQNLKSIGAFFFKPQNLIDFHLTIKRFFNLRSRLIVVYNLGKTVKRRQVVVLAEIIPVSYTHLLMSWPRMILC